MNDLRMYPMTFDEFLMANGRDLLADAVRNLDWDSMTLQHELLTDYLRQYYFCGGMPEAVSTWIENHDAKETRDVQRSILATYSKDMGKHTNAEVVRIRQVWDCIPAQLAKENKKFVFGAIKKGARAADFEKAIQWMTDAGLVYKVARVTKPQEP